MPKEEAAAVQCVARECISHRDFLLQPDFLEVFDLVLHDHRADSEPQELFNGKAIFDQKHLSYVGSLVEVCRVLHVGVEVHIAPTCIKRLRVHVIAPGRVFRTFNHLPKNVLIRGVSLRFSEMPRQIMPMCRAV